VVFDGDYASLTLATDAPDGGEEPTGGAAGHHRPAAGVCGPCRACWPRPLGLVWSRAYVVADIGRADYCAPMMASFACCCRGRGHDEAEADAFVAGLEQASAEDRFFGASNFYTYVARRGA
jgi:hypothetical protein